MRLAERTDYGLRVLMYLAATGGPATVGEMAARYGVSGNHLLKVVRLLTEAGFTLTSRGRGGGVRLARPASEIMVGEVVRALEPDLALVECFRADGACVIRGACRLEGALRRACGAFIESLDAHTLGELVARPAPMLQALGIERA